MFEGRRRVLAPRMMRVGPGKAGSGLRGLEKLPDFAFSGSFGVAQGFGFEALGLGFWASRVLGVWASRVSLHPTPFRV